MYNCLYIDSQNINFSVPYEYNLCSLCIKEKKTNILRRVTSHSTKSRYNILCCSLLKKLLGYRIIHAGSQPANPVARNVHDDDAESKVREVVQDATRVERGRREMRVREKERQRG